MIASNKDTVDFQELADVFGVTERMIRNYLDDIEIFFRNKGLPGIIAISNSTVSIDRKALNDIVAILSSLDFYDYKLSGDEREKLITLTVIASSRQIRQNELENIFHSSRSTIQNDILMVKETLKKYGLLLHNDKQNGLSISGEENDKRQLIFNIVSALGFRLRVSGNQLKEAACWNYIYTALDLETSVLSCRKAISETEKIQDIYLTDDDYYELVLNLAICVTRIRNGNTLDSHTYNSATNGLISSFVRTVYSSAYFKELNINEHEINYLADKIKQNNLLRWTSADEDLTSFYIVVKSFIHQLSEDYKINFSDNDSFLENLVAHIFSVYRGNSSLDQQSKSVTEGLIHQYSEDFATIKKNIKIIEEGLRCSFSDSDIALILVHVLSAIERQIPQNYVPDVMIVCNSGIGTSNFLSVSIRNNFRVNIVAVTSAHNLELVLKKEDPDLIISTIDLNEDPDRWVLVHPVLTADDHFRIKSRLEKILRAKIDSGKPRFDLDKRRSSTALADDNFIPVSELINEKRCQIVDRVRDWRHAITLAAEPLKKDGTINQTYIDAMIRVVEEYGPYILFTPGIVFAHAEPLPGQTKNGLSLLKLNNPVVFGNPLNDPAWLIVVYSGEGKDQISTVLNIMNTLFDGAIISKIKDASSTGEIVGILDSYN